MTTESHTLKSFEENNAQTPEENSINLLDIINDNQGNQKPGNPGWCAPAAFQSTLTTGDKYSRQQEQFGWSESLHTQNGSSFDFSRIDKSPDYFNANLRTRDNLQINWSSINGRDHVTVTLPDGATFSPQGSFSVDLNGRRTTVNRDDSGRIRISQADGQTITFDRSGLVAVSSHTDGVIRQHNMRTGGGGGGKGTGKFPF